MCRKLRFYDNDFRVCGEKMWKRDRRNGIWKRNDNLKPNDKGYMSIELRDDNGNRKKFQSHRIVYKAFHPEWDIMDNCRDNSIDHIDQNKTNNHIDNLRVVTHQKNSFNTNAKGCFYHKAYKKWRALIGLNGKRIHLGTYKTEEEAHNAYLKAKKIYHII